MVVFPLLAVGFIMKIVAVLFVICCVALVLMVLIQKGRGGGLSAAFGGGGMASGILGSKTGDFLTWVTIVLVGVFLTLAVFLAKYYRAQPTGEFDAGQPVRQEQPTDPERPSAAEDIGTTTGDANSGNGAGLPDG